MQSTVENCKFENACKVIVRVCEELYAKHHQIVTIALPKLDSNIGGVILKQQQFLVRISMFRLKVYNSECNVSATS